MMRCPAFEISRVEVGSTKEHLYEQLVEPRGTMPLVEENVCGHAVEHGFMQGWDYYHELWCLIVLRCKRADARGLYCLE